MVLVDKGGYMEVLSIRNNRTRCKCDVCGSLLEFDSDDIYYTITPNVDYTVVGNIMKQIIVGEIYKFYVDCGNCKYPTLLHAEIINE